MNLGEYVKSAPKDGRVLLEGYNLKTIPLTRVKLSDGKKENSIYIVGKGKNIIGVTASYLDYTKILLFVVLPILVALTLLYFFVIR